MLNVLKKVGESRQNVGGGKGNGLEPPKNLPDLARDIYEHEQLKSANTESTQTQNSLSTASRIVSEPNKNSVPKLDLSLVRQHLASSQSAIQSIPVHEEKQAVPPVQDTKPVTAPTTSVLQQNTSQSYTQPIAYQSLFPEVGMMDDSTGFFKEFEDYLRNNGLNNEIVDGLLDKNLLDHMMFYHTTKSEDMPFYASSAELSHAMKLKLEDLQSLERNWISNKQKADLLKKMNLTIESDIHLRSEELKKLMLEFKKRDSAVRSTDFFQIVKPRSVEVAEVTPAPISTVNHDSPNAIVYPDSHHADLDKSIHATNASNRYILNKYVLNDQSKYFYAKNGQVFKSLSELMEGLEVMDRDTFNYHVNDTKNDFSNWIKGIFGDLRLSDAIRSLTDREKLWYYLKNTTY